MIDTDKYEETDHPELVEFEGETLGDTLTNLITEVKRLRETIKAYLDLDMDSLEFCRIMREMGVIE
jgi:hypothetical protein|tara:strand:+ start:300 stop:497 length:198 start_codon:yes stop_codon:yes gene_type:complete